MLNYSVAELRIIKTVLNYYYYSLTQFILHSLKNISPHTFIIL